MKKTLVPALAVGVACGLWTVSPGLAQRTGSFHRTYTVNGPVTLTVATGSGTIHVTGTTGNVVTVDGTVHQSFDWLGGSDPAVLHQIEDNPPITQAGNDIDIHGPRRGWRDNVWISYVITTPPNTQLSAHSGSGVIEISGLNGDADLGAGSGDLQVANLGGNLRAETGSGDISFDKVGGTVRCSTGSGSIEGNEAVGRLNASTGSGDVRVQRLDQGGEVHTASGDQELGEVSGDLTARAASGGIRAGGRLDGNQRWNVSAASGSIVVSLAARSAANLRLETASGRMVVDQPLRTQGEIGRHSWQGVLGEGTPAAELVVRTSSGSIHIH